MNAREQYAFELYATMDAKERSLARLAMALAAEETPVAIDTLKKWSAKYGWADLLQRHELEQGRALAERMRPIHEARRAKIVAHLDSRAESLDKHIQELIDGDKLEGLNIIEAIALYEKIVMLQDRLVGREPSAALHKNADGVPDAAPTLQLSDKQFNELLALDMQQRQGLPPPRAMVKVDAD
jgi:hypothetical protein